MISEELLSEVLGKKVREISDSERDARERGYHSIYCVFVIFENNTDVMINEFELSHKCKEWALENGYIIESSLRCTSFRKLGEETQKYSDGDTEPEAIFKSCQWILDNKDNQC